MQLDWGQVVKVSHYMPKNSNFSLYKYGANEIEYKVASV